jgi:hypothetical protein
VKKIFIAVIAALAFASSSAYAVDWSFDNLLQAFYLEGGGTFEYAVDAKDGYGTAMHMEPRYNVGAGLSFDATDSIEVDMGYRWQDMPPIPGRVHDPLDKTQSLYLEFRYRPFAR